jgi:AmiR/NasT family two-component response regulator
MRVWLVDEKNGSNSASLECQLRRLEEVTSLDLRLVGVSQFHQDFPEAMAKLVPELLDLVVTHEKAWPEGPWTLHLLGIGLGMVMICPPERAERFRPIAEEYPLILVSPDSSLDELWLALVNARTAQRRQCRLKDQVNSLNQRLSDRIVIERAKGILIQTHDITEEEAYKRLQVFSRRQRRKIRDIAQSVLELKSLFAPETNGAATGGKPPATLELASAGTGEEIVPSPSAIPGTPLPEKAS